MCDFYRLILKRTFDLLLVSILFIPSIFLMLSVGGIILAFIGRPILFCQFRPGAGGKVFQLIKFRSMRNLYDSEGKLLSDDRRLTKIGEILRRTSFDELPEIFNVLKGDMSFVGPRPLLMQYIDRYSPEQARRHEVKPGITGWAQVNGRNAISWEEKFELDVWYVDHMSFGLDMKILGMTVWKVLKRADINQEGHATMEEFMGSSQENEA